MLNEEILENMRHIVENCMGEENPACVATCPMHTNVKEYIRLIRDGKGEEAIKVIRDKLFIPRTLGRICAHPCEGKCKWNEGHSPMSIRALKRYAADNFDREEDWDMEIEPENGKHVAVIGAGPSGLQAALDLRRAGCTVTVYEKLPVRGGMMRVGIPEYRLPRDILENEISYLDKLGVNFKMNFEVGKDKGLQEMIDEHDAVVLSVGKHEGRVDRSLEHWDAKGIFSAAAFQREAALTHDVKGTGKCALVVGGGDVAMDCTRTALRVGQVERVYDICLEDSFDSMPASAHEIAGDLEEGVKFYHGQAIKAIHVDENNQVCGVTLRKCVSIFDEEHRFAPKYDDNNTIELPEVDTIIFAIGQAVEGDFAHGILEQCPNTNFVCDHETLQSSKCEKVFCTGEAAGEAVMVIQSMATGRRAAQSVIRFLKGESLTEGREIADTWTYQTKLDMPTNWDEIQGTRLETRSIPLEERTKNFKEVDLGYTREEAEEEADRCRQCECKLCMKECIMLNDFTECPKTLFKEYLETGRSEKMDQVAYSCNECSQCTLKCPNSFDLREHFRAMKADMAKENDGIVPLEALKPSESGQVKECSEEYCTTLEGATKSAEAPKKKTKYVFVPGCTVPAYTPSGVENVVRHLKDTLGDENVGCLLQCCGKVSRFMGEEEKFEERNKIALDKLDEMGCEVIITVCPSCFKIFKETARNQKVISYWDLMYNLIGIPERAKGIGQTSDVVFNFHDSCVTRDEPTHHQSVRWMMDQMGYQWKEIERSCGNTRCCGVGGMVCSSDPKLYERVYTRRVGDFNSDHIITYCGSCRGTFETAGLDSIHMLDLLFGPTYMDGMQSKRGYKDEAEMWQRRLETRQRLNDMKD